MFVHYKLICVRFAWEIDWSFSHNSVECCPHHKALNCLLMCVPNLSLFLLWDSQNGKFCQISSFAVGPVFIFSFSAEKVTNVFVTPSTVYAPQVCRYKYFMITNHMLKLFLWLDLPLTVVCIHIVMNESNCVNIKALFIHMWTSHRETNQVLVFQNE